MSQKTEKKTFPLFFFLWKKTIMVLCFLLYSLSLLRAWHFDNDYMSYKWYLLFLEEWIPYVHVKNKIEMKTFKMSVCEDDGSAVIMRVTEPNLNLPPPPYNEWGAPAPTYFVMEKKQRFFMSVLSSLLNKLFAHCFR